jgi:hypothetical protein
MKSLRKARAQAQAQAYVPLHPFLAGVSDDTPFWRDLPDILQAQLLVMLDNGRPTKANPTPREAEKLLWAGTPYLRKRTIFLLFSLWMVLLFVPTLMLIELVDEIGGWCALAWAVVSVFVFVPRISRGSREAFALTTRRAVVSKRSMYCSIHTAKVHYGDIASASLKMHRDGSGTFTFTKVKMMYQPTEYVIFDRVRDVRGAVRTLEQVLPAEVVEAAGF